MSASQSEVVDAPALDAVRDGRGGLAIWEPGRTDAWLKSDAWVEVEGCR
jgi:hypothetical protein